MIFQGRGLKIIGQMELKEPRPKKTALAAAG